MANVRVSELEFLEPEDVQFDDLVYIARELDDQFKQRVRDFRSSKNYRVIDSDDNILPSDEVLLVYGETAPVEQLTLPDPSEVNSKLFSIKNLQQSEITIVPASPTDTTIEFNGGLTISGMGSVIIYCDGVNYFTVALDTGPSNVLLVDGNADPNIGTRGNLNRRYSNIHVAVEDSKKGDLILVLSGIYYLRNQISQNIAKPGLSMHFMPGTIVYFGYTPFNSTAQQWIDGGGHEPFRCTGYARFIAYSDGVFKRFVTASQNGPLDWYIECESIDTDTQLVASSTGPLDKDGNIISSFNEGTSIFVQDVGGNSNKTIINVHGFMNLRKQAVLFQAQNSGTLCLTVCGDIITHEEAYSIDMRHKNCYVKCRNLISGATDAAIRTGSAGGTKNVINVEDTISCSAGTALKFAHSGTYEIKAKTISSSVAEAVIMSSNTTVRIDGARIITTSVSHNAIQRNTNAGSLRLMNCSIDSAGTYSISGTSATTVNLETITSANKLTNNVSFAGTFLIVNKVFQDSVGIKDDLTIQSLSGNENYTVHVDENGKLIISDVTLRLDDASIQAYQMTGLEYDNLPGLDLDNTEAEVTISDDHNVWYRNTKYEKTTAVVPIVDEDTVTGTRFFYYNEDGILTQSLTAWSLLNEAPITYVYWNHTLQAGKIFDERHTTSFNQIQHRYQHLTLGSKLESAGEISGFTLNVNNIAAITYAVGATTFWDEDIRDVSSAILDGGPYSIWYRLGETAWTWLDTPTLPFLNNGANAWLQFNEKVGSSFQLTELTVNESRYVNYYVIATNIINGPSTVIIPGQIAHTTLNAAQNASIADLELGALTEIFRESVALYKVINHYRHTHNTAGTGRVQIAAIENIQGQRIAQLQSVNINHNLLNNLQGGQLGEYFHLTEDDYNDRITRTEVEDEFVKINDPIEIAFPDGTGPIETAYKAFYDLDEIAIDDPITSYISDIHHGSGTSTIIGYYSEVFATSEATVYGFKSFCECDNGEAYGGYFEGISSNPSTSIYGVYGKAVFRENSYAGYFEGQVSITDDLIIQSLSVNENEILTVDENGKVTPSGIKIDINSLSVFNPYMLQESDLSIDTNDDVFYVPNSGHGNLVAYDPNEIWDITSIPDQIEIIVPTVYAEINEVATFRLDLIILDGQTIIINSDFEGASDLVFPTAGIISILFDKPYGTDTWYVRQSV